MKFDAPHNANGSAVRISPEDQARADIYALLGNLFYQSPTTQILDSIAAIKVICNDVPSSRFCEAWRGLQRASASADAEAVKDEFDTAFIGTGRQPVMLYGSFYLAGFLNEKPLAQLRDELTKMGLVRSGNSYETEDHIAALCDVMRFLIVGDHDTAPASIEVQRDFFQRYINSWNKQLCAAVVDATQTVFYKHVAHVAREFFAVENESFAIA